MKKNLLLLLTLSLLLTARAADVVRVNTSCIEGSAFTLRIPVKFPAGMTVEYVWYRNDTLIEDSQAMLMEGERIIAYTVPDTAAYGAAAFRFEYRCSDGCHEWTSSPSFLVAFLPPQASEITGSTTVCAGTTGLTYTVDKVDGLTYTWTVPTGWTITAGQGTNSITATAGASAISGDISVTPSSSGGSGMARTLSVTVNSIPSRPSAITGGTWLCEGSHTTGQTYSVTNVTGTTYDWVLPTGWTKTAGGTTNSITVTVSGSGTITVTPSNTCGSGTARTLSVTVNATPAQPNTIEGSTSVCAGNIYRYGYWVSTANTSPIWQVPSGWTITSTFGDQAEQFIEVKAGTTGGTISVMQQSNSSGCPGPARTLAVTVSGTAPAQPSAITGNTLPCAGTTGLTYSVTNVSGVTYNWTLPSGWSKTAGGTTNSITVTAGTTTENGQIRVTPQIGSCSGPEQRLTVSSSPPTITLTSGMQNQAVRTGDVITTTTYKVSGSATGASIWWSPFQPSGLSTSKDGYTVTISGKTSIGDAYTYTITTTGPCPPQATITGTIDVMSLH